MFDRPGAFDLLEGRRLGDTDPQPQADCRDHDPEQEGQPPPPGVQRLARQRRRQQPRGAGAGEPADHRAEVGEAAVEAPALPRRVLDEEDDGAAELAAGRDPLDETQDDEQDRREQTDTRVGRQQPEEEGRQPHHRHRNGQQPASPEAVADPAVDHAAERPRQEADGEGRIGAEQRGEWVGGGEELAGEDRGEIAVESEVVPLEHIADDSGGGDAAGRGCRRGRLCFVRLPAARRSLHHKALTPRANVARPRAGAGGCDARRDRGPATCRAPFGRRPRESRATRR